MKCGSFYYYKSGYELKTVNAFPEVSYDDMQPYLFQIVDALESYNPTEDEKSGLFEAWGIQWRSRGRPEHERYDKRCGTGYGRTRTDVYVGWLAYATLAHVVACEQG